MNVDIFIRLCTLIFLLTKSSTCICDVCHKCVNIFCPTPKPTRDRPTPFGFEILPHAFRSFPLKVVFIPDQVAHLPHPPIAHSARKRSTRPWYVLTPHAHFLLKITTTSPFVPRHGPLGAPMISFIWSVPSESIETYFTPEEREKWASPAARSFSSHFFSFPFTRFQTPWLLLRGGFSITFRRARLKVYLCR